MDTAKLPLGPTISGFAVLLVVGLVMRLQSAHELIRRLESLREVDKKLLEEAQKEIERWEERNRKLIKGE